MNMKNGVLLGCRINAYNGSVCFCSDSETQVSTINNAAVVAFDGGKRTSINEY